MAQTPTDKPKESSFIGTVTKRLAGFFQTLVPEPDKTTEAPPRNPLMPGSMSYFQTWADMYADMLGTGQTRLEKYSQYDYLDKNLAEASASLNVYSDNIVSGTIGGEESYSVMIEEDTDGIDELEEIVDQAEKQTRIKDQIWEIARNLTKNGDEYCEVIVQEKEGELEIQKLKELPVRTVEANVDERGVWKDPAKPYIQKSETGAQPIPLDWWRIIHFKVGSQVYGCDYSLFANASLRIGRQLIWIDECLVLARLSRAWQRFAFFIDTGKLGPDDALDFVNRFMNKLRAKRVVSDKSVGTTSIIDAPLLPDEDIGIPVGESSKADMKPMGGDPNIGRIEDVLYLQNKFLMAVTMPKAYVSLEEGVNARATINQLDVQFARQVRRRQNACVPGLRKFYELVFILAGKDPNAFDWEIVFPEMATSDEEIKWNMMMLKAQVAKILAVDVGVVNNDYILSELLEFDADEIEKYGQKLPPEAQPGAVPGVPGENPPTDQPGAKNAPQKGAPPIQLPPQTASMIRRDPEVRRIIDDLKDLVAYKINREKAMESRVEIGKQKKRTRDGINR